MAGSLNVLLPFMLILATAAANSHHHHHYYGQVSNNYGKGQVTGLDEPEQDEEGSGEVVYRFSIGASDLGAYAYLDDDGYLKGAFIDLLQNMCKETGQRCHYMLDDFKRCWQTTGDHEIPGIALLTGAYDACIGMSATPDRLNSFNFTVPFTSRINAGLRFGANKTPAEDNDLTGLTIGFVNGWALNAKCIRRQKDFKGEFKSLFFDTHGELIEALRSGKVDAALTDVIDDEKDEEFTIVKPWLQCTQGGLAVMAHWGSDVINWWNGAYDILIKKYGVKYLCDKAEQRHGQRGKIFCPDY